MAAACLALQAPAAAGDSSSSTCWPKAFDSAQCCDQERYGPGGNAACWEGGFSFDRCCASSSLPKPKEQQVSFMATSRSCWRQGYNYLRCCARHLPQGDPQCFDPVFTFERCCLPPTATPAGFDFEDRQCATVKNAERWQRLKQELVLVSQAANEGVMAKAATKLGGYRTWHYRLQRLLRGVEVLDCPIGRTTLAAARLFMCLGTGIAQTCDRFWNNLLEALRADPSYVSMWAASTWPILWLLQHIGHMMAKADPVACVNQPAGGSQWASLKEIIKSGHQQQGVKAIFGMTSVGEMDKLSDPCIGGAQLVFTVKMAWCMKTEVKCFFSYDTALHWALLQAAESLTALKHWFAQLGDWGVFTLQVEHFDLGARHHYNLGLTNKELALLGMDSELDLQPAGCATPPEDLSPEDFVNMSPFEGKPSTWTVLRRCRAQCGQFQDLEGRPWKYFGLSPERHPVLGPMCSCRSTYTLLHPGNCSAQHPVLYYPMPALLSPAELLLQLPGLAAEAPTLTAAASSTFGFQRDAPVFTTMVFGKMAKYLGPFSNRIRKLNLVNVVVFALDSTAMKLCQAARIGTSMFCLGGNVRSVLQKYVVVILYLALGWNVFWFDFDSVWLQNPMPFLENAQAKATAERKAAGKPEAMIFSAVDWGTRNCVMNAFFFIRASTATLVWVMGLMHWLHDRPFAHDQLAYGLFLGVVPLVDQEPLPKVPELEPLDWNHFANAARFDGLGFSGEVDDLVLFHFFDGWNSGQPEDVEQFATATYRGLNLFEILYGSDEEAKVAAIMRSKKPRPDVIRDCTHLAELGLGITLKEHQLPIYTEQR